MNPFRIVSRIIILLNGISIYSYLKIITFKRFSMRGFPQGIEWGVNIKLRNKDSRISFGKRFYIRKQSDIECLGGHLIIGDDVFLNKNCNIICREGIKIGNDCMFGENVSVYDHNHRINSIPFGKRSFSTDSISIGNNVWIGCNAFIGKGVTIGNNVVVGANEKIDFNIPSNTIYSKGEFKKLHID